MRQIVGYILLLAPFVGFFALMWHLSSLLEATALFAITGIVVGMIVAGVMLIML